jgi:four helix bundle protein
LSDNIVKDKSYEFAKRIIKLYQYLVKNSKEIVLFKQILRSGTSIGSNVEESIGCNTKKDFTNKMGIAYREARETSYWLRLLYDTGYLEKKLFDSLLKDSEELKKILGKIISTSKQNT